LVHAIRDVYHMMGTTRMATSIASGVVDVNCEVFGFPGVYVAGASVFPTGSFSNPTLTAIALAIRLAEHLKGILCCTK
jgi:choline dehydrogenase-like flavoprotein